MTTVSQVKIVWTQNFEFCCVMLEFILSILSSLLYWLALLLALLWLWKELTMGMHR